MYDTGTFFFFFFKSSLLLSSLTRRRFCPQQTLIYQYLSGQESGRNTLFACWVTRYLVLSLDPICDDFGEVQRGWYDGWGGGKG